MALSKPSTIRDVAQKAGLSVATVSRYLNKQLRLPPQTAIRVDLAVGKLAFRPNAIARRLSIGASETLGFITSDIAHPFFAAIASAAEAEAMALGYTLAMFNTRNQLTQELNFLSRIDDQQVDGVLFLTNHTDDGRLRDKIARTRHVVLLDEDVAGTTVPKLFADSEGGARLATRHLIASGHRSIAFVAGPRGLRSSRERARGFRRKWPAPASRSIRRSCSLGNTRRNSVCGRFRPCGIALCLQQRCSPRLICLQSASLQPPATTMSQCRRSFRWWASPTCFTSSCSIPR